MDHILLLRVLYFNASVIFQVWGMSPLHLRWESGFLYTALAPKWPLSVWIQKPQIIVQYGDENRCQVWEIVFDEKNSRFRFVCRRPRNPELDKPSDTVIGDHWILNGAGERIFWVPYEVALPGSEWQERARWVGQTLILGGREGRAMIIDFKGRCERYAREVN